jgi:hypothetical protein
MKAEKRDNTRREEAKAPTRGGILTALRRSPLVGADLDLARPLRLSEVIV